MSGFSRARMEPSGACGGAGAPETGSVGFVTLQVSLTAASNNIVTYVGGEWNDRISNRISRPPPARSWEGCFLHAGLPGSSRGLWRQRVVRKGTQGRAGTGLWALVKGRGGFCAESSVLCRFQPLRPASCWTMPSEAGAPWSPSRARSMAVSILRTHPV